ncbi:MAG: hypothetical protein IJT01_12620 [Selenomonadaceae bacterium]|nr:hypothetical protein [Selenomonadaceae bacterium]
MMEIGSNIDRSSVSGGKEIQEALLANDTFVIHGMECLRREEQSTREKETLDRAKRINIAVLDACVII